MSIYVKHNNEIKSAIPYVKHNGEIKIPTSGWVKTGGELKQIWPPTSGDTAYIYNQATLEAFRDRVNAGETSLNARVIADFTLTGEWTPIGTSSRQYTGTFDGGGHTITGLTINSSSNFQGLFGCISTGGTVKNLNLASTSVTGNGYVGAIAGDNNGGTVENCTNKGDITASDTAITGRAGGIVGYNSGTLTGNTNTGNISGYYAGGIVGYNNENGTVSDNTNEGDISSSYCAGGIAGYNNGTITGNTNTGNISGYHVGGIVGSTSSDGTVENNINTGTVTGTNITTVS